MRTLSNLAMTRDIVLIFCGLIGISLGSIAGVTYMDHFDFEERYRDVTECDPLYWHPLHLPEHCTTMFEDLIRSGIRSNQPLRIMREKGNDVIYHMYPRYDQSNAYYNTDVITSPRRGELTNLSPYVRMLELLRRDVMRDPSAPYIDVLPNIGPAAVYNQKVSRRSEDMIKKISGAYANVYKTKLGDENEYDLETSNVDTKKKKKIKDIKKVISRVLRESKRSNKRS